jgi:hypothetical protein
MSSKQDLKILNKGKAKNLEHPETDPYWKLAAQFAQTK